MDVSQILTAIDAEISRLQQARAAVAALDGASPIPAARRPGRPKGSSSASTATPETDGRKRKRNLSPEGRKRIQEAMKRRWANRSKSGAAAE